MVSQTCLSLPEAHLIFYKYSDSESILYSTNMNNSQLTDVLCDE